MARIVLVVGLIVLSVACATEDGELVPRDIVSDVPWDTAETARYRLLQGDDEKGTGELTLEQAADGVRMTQHFEISDEEITDSIEAQVAPTTLRPVEVRRTIDGPEGKRECNANYSTEGNSVTVFQAAASDERTDTLDVPPAHYDSWTDLFLWRTIDFFEDNEVQYVDVLSCSLAKPDLLSVVLKVKEIEEVAVPAGTFSAWRLEIRSGGRTQKAWYADDERRTLVRYDNGDLVFELESFD